MIIYGENKIYFNTTPIWRTNPDNKITRPVCRKLFPTTLTPTTSAPTISVELADMGTNGCSEYLTATECETYASTSERNLIWKGEVTMNKM